MNKAVGPSPTVLDRLTEYLRAKDVSLDGQERPIAILWTDPKREWRPLLDLMQSQIPELLALGEYGSSERSGPAIWLRCVVDGALDDPLPPGHGAPILYLPGVGRQDLRAGDQCRAELKPLVELMFRGNMWLQHNGSDWGVSTFLTSNRALDLDVAGDQGTQEAMLRALPEIAVTPVSQLASGRLEADDFDKMLSSDVIRDLLRWLGDPQATRARLGENGWGAFRSRTKEEFDFDPEVEVAVTAGERFGMREGAWSKVWTRYEEAPARFPGVRELLIRSRPSGSLLFDREPWPDLNDEDEELVRMALGRLTKVSHGEACETVLQLEEEHAPRRSWIWARMDRSPMATVLEPLSRLAKGTRTAIGGSGPLDMAATYRERGWHGDAAAWEAVASVPSSDEALVSGVVRHLLLPWLEDSARAFQESLNQGYLPGREDQEIISAGENGCVFFCDGLRYDLGQRLAERLEGRGCRVTLSDRWAASPTVTATAKPAVTPVVAGIYGATLEKDFAAQLEPEGRPANAPNLRKVIEASGYQILGGDSLDFPLNDPAHGWIEFGAVDSLGHKLNARLARQLNEELDRVCDRIHELLRAGWARVRVVTDHGWLLVPGGLPKVDLPKHLTESRWARCAVIAGGSTTGVPRFPWYWNSTQTFATAPGVACFNKSEEYAHGGLSLQECLIPDLLVEMSGDVQNKVTITSIKWHGLRCFIATTGVTGVVRADLRVSSPGGESVAAAAKTLDDGACSLVMAGEDHEEASLVLVLIDENGTVLAHRPTTVGQEL